jgi:hypothetical protein
MLLVLQIAAIMVAMTEHVLQHQQVVLLLTPIHGQEDVTMQIKLVAQQEHIL